MSANILNKSRVLAPAFRDYANIFVAVIDAVRNVLAAFWATVDLLP